MPREGVGRTLAVIGFRLYGMERGIDMIKKKKITAPLGAASADK